MMTTHVNLDLVIVYIVNTGFELKKHQKALYYFVSIIEFYMTCIFFHLKK